MISLDLQTASVLSGFASLYPTYDVFGVMYHLITAEYVDRIGTDLGEMVGAVSQPHRLNGM